LSPLAELTMRWASGWVRSRGVPTPERTEWGLRIEVGSERELIRHLVLDPAPERTAELAETITEPRVWIKSPVAPSVLRPVLDADWVEDQPVFLMTWDVRPLPVRVPPGYTVRTTTADAVTHVVILAEDGSTAAQARYGHADGHGTPDQVSTDPAHQRRGLGTALMSALANAAHEAGESESILAASLQGRALYESLGWKLQAPLAGFVYKP
jgi:GNAT superfamily N-acetyltransferase